MHGNILLCGAIYVCQLILCQPQILIGKTNRHTGYFVIVLVKYYFVCFFHRMSFCWHTWQCMCNA